MHRRTLTLRRFGPLSYGLGYFEDGKWVDHAVGDMATVEATDRERASLDAIHGWFGCCAETDVVVDAPAMMPQVVRSASS